MGWADAYDYYAVTLTNASDVAVTLGSLSADADLQLIRDTNGNRILDSGEILATSAVRGSGNETIARQLAAATYYVRVARYSGDTTFRLTVAAAPRVVPDNNLGLLDADLAALTASLVVDGSLSRNDMMSILRSAGSDDSRVDAVEMADFRTILAHAAQYQLQDYVRSLTTYVVNGNQANASFQGQALGNLAAGSSAAQLNKLVDKWFLGADHPNADGYGYQAYAGQLFVNGPAYTDIEQGQVGDCYLVATFGALAKSDPSAITSMFTDNGDNTYTVRFYGSNGAADYVTVDCQFATASWGGPVYAGVGTYSPSSTSNELWVALLEKAYVQWNETGGTGPQRCPQRLSGHRRRLDERRLWPDHQSLWQRLHELDRQPAVDPGQCRAAEQGGHARLAQRQPGQRSGRQSRVHPDRVQRADRHVYLLQSVGHESPRPAHVESAEDQLPGRVDCLAVAAGKCAGGRRSRQERNPRSVAQGRRSNRDLSVRQFPRKVGLDAESLKQRTNALPGPTQVLALLRLKLLARNVQPLGVEGAVLMRDENDAFQLMHFDEEPQLFDNSLLLVVDRERSRQAGGSARQRETVVARQLQSAMQQLIALVTPPTIAAVHGRRTHSVGVKLRGTPKQVLVRLLVHARTLRARLLCNPSSHNRACHFRDR